MSNFDTFKSAVIRYLSANNIAIDTLVSTLHESSLNDTGNEYLYNGKLNLDVISMDALAKDGYKLIKSTPSEHPITTADSFLINKDNEWYLIEFKDQEIRGDKKGVKDNIIKKAYENWYMILNILYSLMELGEENSIFDFKNPVKFAQNHVSYILVCRADKNANIYNQVKNHALLNENYTPPFMQRLKDYIFKDAYVFTEDYFENKFVESFVY